MKYFIADLHLLSDSTVYDYIRPFENGEHACVALIDSINRRVTDDDDLYIVGDFFDYSRTRKITYDRTYKLIPKVKGRKHLIYGNNEERLCKDKFKSEKHFNDWLLTGGFSTVCEHIRKVHIQGNDFYLTHKPENCLPNVINIHGHTHMSGRLSRLGINVACDATGYQPMSEEELYRSIYLYYAYAGTLPMTMYIQKPGDRKLWLSYLKNKTGKQYSTVPW